MLFDRATIEVRAGAGGKGCMSFRREAHVPKGGPDGGDGGRGANVILRCDDSLRDLQAFRRRAHFYGDKGGNGQGALRHGADGDPLLLRVPPGTQIARWDGLAYDLTKPGQEVILAQGGSGGRGNKRFANSVRQAPRFAERGLPGEEGLVELQLKLLADVGLIGLPNAGKSSLLSRLTKARPKIAAYPFTTLEPILGTVDTYERQLVLADIPGLIEGASAGVGLGHDFLAHIERTSLLVHVLELDPVDGSDGEDRFQIIENELKEYDARLAGLPRILVLSKSDLVSKDKADLEAKRWQELLPDTPIIVTSSASHAGIDLLTQELGRRVPLSKLTSGDESAATPLYSNIDPGNQVLAEYKVFKPGNRRGFTVEKVKEGSFSVNGEGITRLFARHDLDNDEALAYIEHRLIRMGVITSLQNAGFKSGDSVEIAGVSFDLNPESM